jgi:adenylate cyclase
MSAHEGKADIALARVGLEGIAEPDGVCMSDDTYRQIRGKIEFVCDDLGPQTLKNIAEPMKRRLPKLADTVEDC